MGYALVAEMLAGPRCCPCGLQTRSAHPPTQQPRWVLLPSAIRTSSKDYPLGITAQNKSFLISGKAQQADLLKLQPRVQPRSVASKQDFNGSSPLHRLHQIIKPPYARRVTVNVRIAHELIDNSLLCLPIVLETAEMRDDEVHVRIFGREQLDDLGPANHIDEQGDTQ